MASDIRPPSDKKGKAREKVALKPGFHLTDWVRLTQHANDLSGRGGMKTRSAFIYQYHSTNVF